ncbi:MAG: thiamine pyrophosphate-dependent enzyme [SAR202 cluster bacterium]|nr:thiamine pyrophosphate-dependent enzyme [SAR202 cluster bacterium]MDP6512946.1 thiamine pyrophosphate-dependent enzyme [SAR202 cluster bacterium]
MIDARDIFNAFQEHRGDAIVGATGRAGRHWKNISTNANRDLTVGGAMGHSTSAMFGLALGLPDEKVVHFDSEGSLLMNLGLLATVAGKKPKNFFHILLDNESYATTGGQPVPNAEEINYAGMAREAGYASTHEFNDLEDFVTNIGSILNETGPVFVSVKIFAEVENAPIAMRVREPSRSRAETIADLRAELGISD